jgi:hypothetical protein
MNISQRARRTTRALNPVGEGYDVWNWESSDGGRVPDLILSLASKFQGEIADAVANGCKLQQRHRKIKKSIENPTPIRYTQRAVQIMLQDAYMLACQNQKT